VFFNPMVYQCCDRERGAGESLLDEPSFEVVDAVTP